MMNPDFFQQMGMFDPSIGMPSNQPQTNIGQESTIPNHIDAVTKQVEKPALKSATESNTKVESTKTNSPNATPTRKSRRRRRRRTKNKIANAAVTKGESKVVTDSLTPKVDSGKVIKQAAKQNVMAVETNAPTPKVNNDPMLTQEPTNSHKQTVTPKKSKTNVKVDTITHHVTIVSDVPSPNVEAHQPSTSIKDPVSTGFAKEVKTKSILSNTKEKATKVVLGKTSTTGKGTKSSVNKKRCPVVDGPAALKYVELFHSIKIKYHTEKCSRRVTFYGIGLTINCIYRENIYFILYKDLCSETYIVHAVRGKVKRRKTIIYIT